MANMILQIANKCDLQNFRSLYNTADTQTDSFWPFICLLLAQPAELKL